ncbi:MAG: 3'-5' exonuclease [Bdellovibrionales bacterium]|nr:3'-5' exonuclease [Bdellovibrionales bacterium]
MNFIALDLETTGTLPYVDHIVEIAAVLFKSNEVSEVFQTLVNPKMEISPEATRINGITNQMVQSQPVIEEVLESFADFCSDYLIVAHNATFDFQFLKSAIEKYKSKAPLGEVLDTYSLAKKALPGLSNYKLGTLVKHLKIEHNTLHRAEQDARCCGQLFQKIINQLRTTNVKQLVQFSGKSALKFPQVYHAHPQLQLL